MSAFTFSSPHFKREVFLTMKKPTNSNWHGQLFIGAICSICIYLAINGIISSSLKPLFPAVALF